MTSNRNAICDYEKIKSAIESKCDLSNIRRLGITFQTPRSLYFYDTGTGKVLECNKCEYRVLTKMIADNSFNSITKLGMSQSELIEALEGVYNAIVQENILQAPPLTQFYCNQNMYLEKCINNHLEMITLEITERCNLRCDYCAYQNYNSKFRSYGDADMPFEIAQKSIDYLISHSKEIMDPISITFYGGEPLLRYDFIKKCISYCGEKAGNRKCSYSLTSNLTLLTKEMANYFSENNVSILVSLDGDKKADEHRVYANGDSSFEKALNNLQILIKAYGNKAPDLISVNSVISASSANAESFERIQKFWDGLTWFPKKCSIQYSFIDVGLATSENCKSILKGIETHDYLKLNPVNVWRNKRAKGSVYYESDPQKKLFSNSNTQSNFIHIHDRIITKMPSGHYKLNACCMPCSRRLYITTKGNFKLCERIGNSPNIGNLDQGVDIASVKKYFVRDYQEKSLNKCKNCWAVNLCTVCYAQCFDENGINMEAKDIECRVVREALLNNLRDYHAQLEAAPDTLTHLNQIQVR